MNLTPAALRNSLLRPADLQLTSPDAHLLTLRNALLQAWEEELRLSSDGNPEWMPAADRAHGIAKQMVEIRAHTLAGFQAKAIAVAHCQTGNEDNQIILDDQQTTDVRLAQSILADLLGRAA